MTWPALKAGVACLAFAFAGATGACAGGATAAATSAAPAQAAQAVKPVPTPHLIVKPSDKRSDSVIFVWHGRVQAPMADEIAKAFEQHRGHTRRILFKLDSGGGSVAEGEKVIAVLRKMKQTHQLDTFVGAGWRCGSMCVPIYVQGSNRHAAPASLWLFHEVSFKDPVTHRVTRLDRGIMQRLVGDYFVPAGVSQTWIADMMQHTSGTDYWRTGEDLIRDKSGIVQKALSDEEKRIVSPNPKVVSR